MSRRLYSCTSLQLLNAARDFATSLGNDLSDFAAVNPNINAAYLAAFHAEIQAAEVLPPASSVAAHMTVLTEAVAAQVEAAYRVLRPVAYYVGEVWPGSKAHLREFGLDRLKLLLRSRARMVNALGLSVARLAEFSALFLAKGMTQAQIDAVSAARDALEAAIGAQEAFGSAMPRNTDDRVGQYNKVYGIMRQINALAKVVYEGDAASLGRYKLPRKHIKPKKEVVVPEGILHEVVGAPQTGVETEETGKKG